MALRWETGDDMWPNGVRLGLSRFSPIGLPRFPARRKAVAGGCARRRPAASGRKKARPEPGFQSMGRGTYLRPSM